MASSKAAHTKRDAAKVIREIVKAVPLIAVVYRPGTKSSEMAPNKGRSISVDNMEDTIIKLEIMLTFHEV